MYMHTSPVYKNMFGTISLFSFFLFVVYLGGSFFSFWGVCVCVFARSLWVGVFFVGWHAGGFQFTSNFFRHIMELKDVREGQFTPP